MRGHINWDINTIIIVNLITLSKPQILYRKNCSAGTRDRYISFGAE